MPPRPVIACTSSDGTEKYQTCHDEGPLTLDCSRTVDEEISTRVIDYLDRNDPKKTGKPFFVWYNPARMLSSICFMQASLMPSPYRPVHRLSRRTSATAWCVKRSSWPHGFVRRPCQTHAVLCQSVLVLPVLELIFYRPSIFANGVNSW
jgi:hypothetical protein